MSALKYSSFWAWPSAELRAFTSSSDVPALLSPTSPKVPTAMAAATPAAPTARILPRTPSPPRRGGAALVVLMLFIPRLLVNCMDGFRLRALRRKSEWGRRQDLGCPEG